MAALATQADDWMLIDRMQRAAFTYFDDFTNPANGLVADHSASGSPASIAAVGFGLTALPVGVERGWISRDAALARALATARFFEGAAASISRHGFFYHFLDWNTGARAWNSEISSIDTSILCLGLLTASAFFDGSDADETELRERVDRITSHLDWRWMLSRYGHLRMGWKPEYGFLKHKWRGYSEALLAYIPGLGARQNALSLGSYLNWRQSFEWIDYEGLPYAYAGPLFIHLFPHVWFDLSKAPAGKGGLTYLDNSRRAIMAQSAYAEANPHGFSGYSAHIWGFSSCPGPMRRCALHDGRRKWIAGYAARGAPYGLDDGTLATWAALASLPLAPNLSRASLAALLDAYPQILINDRFCDAFNPGIRQRGAVGWYSGRCTALDQGLLVAMIENARSGLIHCLAGQLPQLQRGLAMINDAA